MTTPSRDVLRAWTAALTPEPLDPSDPAETRYVELRHSGHGAMNAMMATIDLALDTTTQLLSGPSGSGKTTELNRLRGDLSKAGYRVGMFDVADYVNLSSPISVTEFLVAMALGAHTALAPEQARHGPGFVARLRDLLGRLKVSLDVPGFTAEMSAEGMKVETLGVGVDVALGQELRSSRPFVDELRTKLGYNVGELYAEVATFLQELFAEHPGEQGSVLIVDGLEKLRSSHFSDTEVQESAEQLFVGQSGRLKFPSHHMIYTVPTYLQFTSPGALPYDLRVPVPVPHVRPRRGAGPSTVTQTITELREAISRRIPVEEVFVDIAQVDRIIEASGGHLRDLFTLLQRLVNIIYQRSAPLPVADDDITRAINVVAQPFGQMTEEQEAFLRQVDAGDGTVRPAADEVQLMARLLVTHMLLGHLNGEDWYEVHPLTRRALGLPMTERSGAVGLHRSVERAWGELRADVDLQSGFWLAFLFGAETPEITEMVARTRDLVRASARRVDVITVSGDTDVSAVLVELLTPQSPELAVTWLADAGPHADRESTWITLLRRLNERRDVLRAARPSGLIVACPARMLPTVRDQAPDLWGFRTTVITLGEVRTGPIAAALPTESAAEDPNPYTPVPGPPIQASEAVARRLGRAARALQRGAPHAALAEATAAFDDAVAPDDTTLAHGWLARARDALGDGTEAVRHARTALGARRPLDDETALPLLEIVADGPDLDEAASAAAGLVAVRSAQVDRLPGSPAALGDLSIALDLLGDIEADRGRLDDALRAYDEALALDRLILDRNGESPDSLREVTIALEKVGDLRYGLGQLDEAMARYTESLALARRVLDRTGETAAGLADLASSLVKVGDVQAARGQLDDALTSYAEALALRRRLLDLTATPQALLDLSISLNKIGDIEEARGRLDDALTSYTESLDLRRRLLDQPDATPRALRDLSVSLDRVGDMRERLGRLDEALAGYTEALAIDRRILDADSTPEAWRDLAVTLNKIGDIRKAYGRLDEALACYTEALDLRRDLVGRDPAPDARRDVAISLTRVGDVLSAQGRPDDAYRHFAEGLDLARGLLDDVGETPNGLRDLLISLIRVGVIEESRGLSDRALAEYTEALHLARRILEISGDTPQGLRDLTFLLALVGALHEAAGRTDAARAAWTESLDLARRIHVTYGHSPTALTDVSVAAEAVGRLAEADGDTAGAVTMFREALDGAVRVEELFGAPYTEPERIARLRETVDRLGGPGLA